jgi:thioester reductase-like protein
MAEGGGGAKKQRKASTRSKRAAPAKERIKHAFLTGYPGFIGKRLAKRLLSVHRRAKLTLLVQEKFRQSAEEYVREMPDSESSRVRLLVGDVAKMDLGLSGPEIEELCDEVTHVFHLAAVQYLGVGAEEASRVNVTGVRNVLTLAREMKHLVRFVHFSTCYVSGDRIGVITEDELDEGQRFRNHYEETKFRGERIVRAAMDSLPITVLRPAVVIGDSQTGEIDRFDGVYAMGILVVTSPVSVPLPLPGEGIAPLNLVPVDFITRAATQLATDPEARGKTFHLVDPNPLSSRHVYELIARKSGKKLPRVPFSYGIARRILRMPLVERFSRVQAQALDYLNHLAIYNCSNTLTHLEGTGILCPRFDTYVDALIAYVRQHMRKDRRLKRGSADPLDA